MRKALSSLQDLRRRIYHKAKSEQTQRFWGLLVHVAKLDTLTAAYQQAKRNGGAPGLDGQTFAAIEALGLTQCLEGIRDELLAGTSQPQPHRAVEIPKEKGKVRKLQIPCSRDRVVQGALKLILEAICEADFCPTSYGYRPKRSPQQTRAAVRRSLLRRMSTGIEVD
jgi:RNA-directed DNA polymerase